MMKPWPKKWEVRAVVRTPIQDETGGWEEEQIVFGQFSGYDVAEQCVISLAGRQDIFGAEILPSGDST